MRINGKDYRIPEITFGFALNLKKEKGIDLKELLIETAKYSETAIVTFISLAVDCDEEKTAELIDQYFAEGGDFTGLLEEINRAVEESGFFQAWLRTMEKARTMAKAKFVPKKK